MLANPAMASQGSEYTSSQAIANNKFSKAISRPFRETSFLSTEQKCYKSGWDGFRE